jgi:hypothetical protein
MPIIQDGGFERFADPVRLDERPDGADCEDRERREE